MAAAATLSRHWSEDYRALTPVEGATNSNIIKDNSIVSHTQTVYLLCCYFLTTLGWLAILLINQTYFVNDVFTLM